MVNQADVIARLVVSRDLTVAVAESLTGGMLSGHLAQAEGASGWYRGGIVAYASDVKYDVLGVPRGPVITRAAAVGMAEGVAKLLGADAAVAVTGVGGPDSQDGQPPGTVWVASFVMGDIDATKLNLTGSPPEVCEKTCEKALQFLTHHLQGSH
jgi:nicotinamide-nucleotide amidase